MSYAMASALQEAVFLHLEAEPNVVALVGDAIYDTAPAGALPGTYVTIGPEDVRDRSDCTQAAAAHDFTISVVTDSAGFQKVKAVASAISDALIDAPLTLSRGRLVGLNFLRAKADRLAKGTQRKVDLRFRALVEDN